MPPLKGLALLLSPLLGFGPALAMSSPWWEDYEQRDRYLCSDQATIVVERNDAQAAVLTGRHRSTLFREPSAAPGLRYSNDLMRLILRGDELTLERLPLRLTCIRTDEV
ncbi:MAG: hypothetical protein VKI81_01645 [Synechococcaceae cyanobacterium]|nr:hypothetical protein [Synechococcaceae cyanobacterium]